MHMSYRLHEDCKILTSNVYNSNKKNVDNWQYSRSWYAQNGFHADVYKKQNNIMLVFRGTDLNNGLVEGAKDMFANVQIVMRKFPNQLNHARNLYKYYKQNENNSKIILTGHSLGGSIAQALGAETGAETVTFAAYGIANTHSPSFKYTNNITNYGNSQDPVFVGNIDAQLGKTILLNTNIEANQLTKTHQKSYSINFNPHYMQNFGDLSNGIEYKKEIFEDDRAPVFKIGAEYNDYNPDEIFDTKNRVLYKGEINIDDLEEGTPLYDLYLDNLVDISPMPTKKEVDKRVRIGELIYVKDYTREDGTKVSGYYRAYPKK